MFGLGKNKKVEVIDCNGLLKTGKQTIPCPRVMPCPHHEEGKGIYNLAEAREIIEFGGEDSGLTVDEKLDGLFAFLEEMHDGIRIIGLGMGIEIATTESELTAEELMDEAKEEGTEEPEPEEEATPVLKLDDIPKES